jgi:uncharacterized protein YkwD
MIRSLLLPAALAVAGLACGPGGLEPAGSTPAASPSPAAAARSEARAVDEPAAARALLAEVNAERRRAGSPPLSYDPRLARAAQEHAEALARSGVLRLDESKERMRERLERAGYRASQWVESAATSNEGPADVVEEWKRREAGLYREVMGSDYGDAGVGISRLGGMPLYVMLFAQSQSDRFARETAPLGDLAAVRRAMLARVNAERRRAGRGLLREDPRLGRAAQRHAEDMLRRGYFAHESPERTTPRERVKDAGYRPGAVAENLAAGQTSVDEVMDGWMKSPGHRTNLLGRDYKDFGLGLAVGRGPRGEETVWVQEFGKER